jgi:peptidoglycan/xylan/chitin deacetylase (PgdA/CDA1 family)
MGALQRVRRKRAVILGYHGIATVPRKDDLFLLQLSPERFRIGIEMMLAAGFRFVTVAELARLAAGGPPPPGLAAVSFDDGMRNVLTAGMPILTELGIPATVYVPSAWLGGTSPWISPGASGDILSEAELKQLAAAGWEIGAHTVTHADLSTLDYERCREEIDGSIAALQNVLSMSVETFAYPFGRYGIAAIEAVRDSGLLAAVTTGSGTWDRLTLTRAMVGGADPFPVLLLKMVDCYEPLLRFPPLAFGRRSSKQLRARLQNRRGQRAQDIPAG